MTIRALKPLPKNVVQPYLSIVGPEKEWVTNGHWAIKIGFLREGELIASPDYVRAYCGVNLDVREKGVQSALTSLRNHADRISRWDVTGWRYVQNPHHYALFQSEVDKEVRYTAFNLAYCMAFNIVSLFGIGPDDVFVDTPSPDNAQFMIMPVRATEMIAPLVTYIRAQQEMVRL